MLRVRFNVRRITASYQLLLTHYCAQYLQYAYARSHPATLTLLITYYSLLLILLQRYVRSFPKIVYIPVLFFERILRF